MPPRKPLPPRFAEPFAFPDAVSAGIGAGRLRGSDLITPYRGVRARKRENTAKPFRIEDEQIQDALLQCATYRPLMRPGDYFSHTTAAALWGCPLPPFYAPTAAKHGAIHVTARFPASEPRSAGVNGHRTAAAQTTRRYGFAVSNAAATWLAMAAILPLDDLVAAGDHLVLNPAVLNPHDLRPHTTIDELRRELAGFSGRGARAAASALLLIRQGAESRPETLLRLLLERAGLPAPELNVPIWDVSGRWLARGDIVYPHYKTLVEYDGHGHLASIAQYEKDITRIENLVVAGQHVVRVRSRGLFQTPEDTVKRAKRALGAGGWQE